jgi:hypothetical protein
MAVEETLRLESTEGFPLFHRHDGEVLKKRSTKVCGGEKETKEQSNGVSENLLEIARSPGTHFYKDRHVRIIIECPESDSPQRGRIHLRGLSFRPTSNLLQFGGGPYIFTN